MPIRKRPLQLAVLALATVLASFGTAAAPAQAAASLDVGQTKTFSHLKVTVSKVDRRSDSYFFGAKIKVCVTSLPKGQSSMRLSWEPWTLNGGVQPGMFEEGQDPWASSNAPTEGYYKVGQCMSGWLPFAVDGTKKVTKISYANALGNTTSWQVTTGATPQRALGSKATFTYFTVQVTDTRQSEQGFRAWAKVCVVKLPPGSTGGKTRISWDPWVANAGTHFAYSPYVYDTSHTWANLFPKSGRYKKGQCAKGWVPFEGVPTELEIDRVAYRNSLGNQAFWTAN
ncbi:MAG TPA: hypothetical protein VIT20_09930 [Propionibacteriaceae bacterium]